jgi:hypothetical protein
LTNSTQALCLLAGERASQAVKMPSISPKPQYAKS